MSYKLFLELKNNLEKLNEKTTVDDFAKLLLEWLHNHSILLKLFSNHHSDIKEYYGIYNIYLYPVLQSEFVKNEEIIFERDILIRYINKKSNYIYQKIASILNRLFLVQDSDKECPICDSIYGFDIWKEISTRKLVWCCKTCAFSMYVDGKQRNVHGVLEIPTINDLNELSTGITYHSQY